MSNPFFSVIVPLYNKADTVTRTIDSILSQDLANFEVIVVDDGSTDQGVCLVRAIGDNRVRVIQQANAGPGAARNTGLRTAKGEWIAFVDADDLVARNHLRELSCIAARYPGAGLIGTAFEEVHRSEVDLRPRAAGAIECIDFFDLVAHDGNPLCASSAAVRRDIPASVGYFGDAKLGEDREYWARIALSYPVAASSRVTSYYRRDVGGAMAGASRRWLGRSLQCAGDIAPAAAVAEGAVANEAYAAMSDSLKRFVDQYVRYCLHASIAIGDIATIRQLPGLYHIGPRADDRIWLQIARLPLPLARFALLCIRMGRFLSKHWTPAGRSGEATRQVRGISHEGYARRRTG